MEVTTFVFALVVEISFYSVHRLIKIILRSFRQAKPTRYWFTDYVKFSLLSAAGSAAARYKARVGSSI